MFIQSYQQKVNTQTVVELEYGKMKAELGQNFNSNHQGLHKVEVVKSP